MKTYLNGRLTVTTGDITKSMTDAIVNAANSSLLGGGGVDGAIHAAGGSQILKECKEIRNHQLPEGLPPGKAVMTSAGKLPSTYVIHTVGPIWYGGSRNEEKTLYNAYFNSLLLAKYQRILSVSFPAISTGIYGFPKDKASQIAFSAIKNFTEENDIPEKIYFVFFSKNDEKLFNFSIAEMFKEQD